MQVNDSLLMYQKPSDFMNKRRSEREREKENKTARRRNVREGFFVSLIAQLEA